MSNNRLLNFAKRNTGLTITNAGIYTNCDVTLDYVTAVSSNGNSYKTFKVTVTLEDGSSKTFNLMKPSRGFAREIEVEGVKKLQSDKEALIEAEDKVLDFIYKVVSLVDPNEISNIEAEDFDGIAEGLVKLAKNNQEKYNPKFNVKIVLDKNFKYTELPKYGAIELFKEGKEPKLKFTDKDRIKVPESSSDSMDLPGESLGTISDNLPF